MAILQTTDDLEEHIGNKYSLVIVSAKRARQLKEGHQPLAPDTSPNALSIAMREIQEHKVASIAPPEEEVAPAPRDVITSLVTGADFDLGDEDLDLEDSDAVDDLAALLVGGDEEEAEETEEPEADTEDDDTLTADSSDEDDEEEAADDADAEDEEAGLDVDEADEE